MLPTVAKVISLCCMAAAWEVPFNSLPAFHSGEVDMPSHLQVGVAVMRLHDGKPHYAWLPLQKRTDRDSVSGEVHLRMQWVSEELDTPADAALNLVVDMLLHGIGLSVVESSVKALPREVCLCVVSVLCVTHGVGAED